MTREELHAELAAGLGSAAEARWVLDDLLDDQAGKGPDDHAVERARTVVRRRASGEPLQYILGHWAFRALDLVVDPRVLIPRPETEQVVEVALGELDRVAAERSASGGDRRDVVVVDLGTGSGAVALAVAAEARKAHPRLRVVATDVDAGSLEVAARNRRLLGTGDPGAAELVTLRQGTWWSALPTELRGRVDVAVSNPPYVSEAEWPMLEPEVQREPQHALVSPAASDGTPGLGAVEAVLEGLGEWLARPGAAVVEVAPHQVSSARRMALLSGADEVRVANDLAGRQRALVIGFGR